MGSHLATGRNQALLTDLKVAECGAAMGILPPHSATMDDCCRIAEILFGNAPSSTITLTIGFLEITSRKELSVTAVYTATNIASRGADIDVQQIEGRKVGQAQRATKEVHK